MVFLLLHVSHYVKKIVISISNGFLNQFNSNNSNQFAYLRNKDIIDLIGFDHKIMTMTMSNMLM